MTTISAPKRTDYSQRIVSAAVRVKVINYYTNEETLIIIPSVRHFDSITNNILDIFQSSHDYSIKEDKIEQGFVDNFGRFLTRKEANEIAVKTGQKLWQTSGDENVLYSEDLY